MKKLTLTCFALLFASMAFAGEPAKGELGSNCTTGLSEGVVFKTNCSVSEVYKGSKSKKT